MPPRKPPDREIPLDDYALSVNGETYHPHEGEAIWLAPLDSVEMALETGRLTRFKVQLEAVQGDKDAELAAVGIMRDLLDDVAAFLGQHATRWTVTDARGEPCPQPDGTPEAAMKLGKGLLLFVFGVVAGLQGESKADRKNG